MKAGLILVLLFIAGCGESVYIYRVMNDDCSCEVFRSTDKEAHIAYSYSAVYSVSNGFRTRITVSIRNNNPDTLDLSAAYVRIFSRNIPYAYNGRFLPVTIPGVPPGAERTLTLEGIVEDVKLPDPWLAIPGEELTVTLRGMRVMGKTAAEQVVRFVPHNPKLSL